MNQRPLSRWSYRRISSFRGGWGNFPSVYWAGEHTVSCQQLRMNMGIGVSTPDSLISLYLKDELLIEGVCALQFTRPHSVRCRWTSDLIDLSNLSSNLIQVFFYVSYSIIVPYSTSVGHGDWYPVSNADNGDYTSRYHDLFFQSQKHQPQWHVFDLQPCKQQGCEWYSDHRQG